MEQKTCNPWRNFIWAGGAVFVVWLAFAAYTWFCVADHTKSGPYGDTFGFLNTLFTGLAFAGMICTLIMQKQELELQRQELADTRAELARTAKANEETAKLAKENIEVQRIQSILEMRSRYVQCELDFIYKTVEYEGIDSHSKQKVFNLSKKLIQAYIKEIRKLYQSIGAPPSTPEA